MLVKNKLYIFHLFEHIFPYMYGIFGVCIHCHCHLGWFGNNVNYYCIGTNDIQSHTHNVQMKDVCTCLHKHADIYIHSQVLDELETIHNVDTQRYRKTVIRIINE
jgi:hypothetical protein